MSEFVREPRYVVFKMTDIVEHLNEEEWEQIVRIGEKIGFGRIHSGKPPFNAVVVESDWPEFEMVWKSIESRS